MTNVQYMKCDQCHRTWEEAQKFEVGAISVQHLTVYFPSALVLAKRREGISDSHCAFVEEKDFCCVECLAEHIRARQREHVKAPGDNLTPRVWTTENRENATERYGRKLGNILSANEK